MKRGLLAGLALAMVACPSKPTRPWIDRLQVDAFEGGEVISLSKAQLEQMLVARLTAANFEVAAGDKKPPADVKPWRIDLATGLTEPDLDERTSAVLLALDVRHTGDAEPIALTVRSKVAAPKERDVEAMQSAIRASLEDGLTSIVKEAAAVITLDGATNDALASKLADADLPTRHAAVRLLARRKDRRALPVLLERLKADDLDSLRNTIGLLVELGASESVNPLIEAGHQRGDVFAREIVFAVSSIGGTDAEAYLDLVATGHDDSIVRASAEQALSELRERQKKKNPNPAPDGAK